MNADEVVLGAEVASAPSPLGKMVIISTAVSDDEFEAELDREDEVELVGKEEVDVGSFDELEVD